MSTKPKMSTMSAMSTVSAISTMSTLSTMPTRSTISIAKVSTVNQFLDLFYHMSAKLNFGFNSTASGLLMV